MNKSGLNWLVTLLLAAAVIAAVFGIFIVRIKGWAGSGMTPGL